MTPVVWRVSDKRKNDDRAVLWSGGGCFAALVADGATGVGRGDLAAEHVMERLPELLDPAMVLDSAAPVPAVFDRLDREVERLGECDTTAVVAFWDATRLAICGAGDSRAMFFPASGGFERLDGHIRARPRIGGGAWPVAAPEIRPVEAGFLLLFSDGLSLSAVDIAGAIAAHGENVCPVLEANVRAANFGHLPDDLTLVLVKFSGGTE